MHTEPATVTGEMRQQWFRAEGWGLCTEPASVGGQLGNASAHAGRCTSFARTQGQLYRHNLFRKEHYLVKTKTGKYPHAHKSVQAKALYY